MGALAGTMTNEFKDIAYFPAIIGFVVGYLISSIALSVIESAVLTVFVCFAEDPNSLYQHHPDLYQGMMSAWCQIYPDVMIASGYYA